MRTLFLVGIGGAAGSIVRYGIGSVVNKVSAIPFPIATFGVNIVGSFIIGLLCGFSLRGNNWLQQDMMLLLATGFCGGFTTFSTFAFESVDLMQKGQTPTAIFYAVLSVVCGLMLCRLGLWLVAGSV